MDESIYKRATEKWGIVAQLIVAIEEMSELIKEISKWFRRNDNRLEILNELADVLIMMKQVQILFDFTDNEINDRISYKLKRIEERLNRE